MALFTIWAISVLSFVIIQLPPIDFIDTYITERIGAGGVQVTPEQIQALRAQYGADQPKPIQYLRWVGLMLHGDNDELVPEPAVGVVDDEHRLVQRDGHDAANQ